MNVMTSESREARRTAHLFATIYVSEIENVARKALLKFWVDGEAYVGAID